MDLPGHTSSSASPGCRPSSGPSRMGGLSRAGGFATSGGSPRMPRGLGASPRCRRATRLSRASGCRRRLRRPWTAGLRSSVGPSGRPAGQSVLERTRPLCFCSVPWQTYPPECRKSQEVWSESDSARHPHPIATADFTEDPRFLAPVDTSGRPWFFRLLTAAVPSPGKTCTGWFAAGCQRGGDGLGILRGPAPQARRSGFMLACPLW